MLLGQEIHNSTDLVVFGHDGVAMQQNDGRPGAALEVVETDPVDLDELAFGRMTSLGPCRHRVVENSRCRQQGHTRCRRPQEGLACHSRQ